MNTLLIDMPSGIAGDMLLAALIDLGANQDAIQATLDGLGLGPLPLITESVRPGGITATRLSVAVDQAATWQPQHAHAHEHEHEHKHKHKHKHKHEHEHENEHEHEHRDFAAIRALLAAADLPERVHQRALAAFTMLAQAEAAVHGVADWTTVHFHEVGSADAIADVVGTCLALEDLQIDQVLTGPLTLGQGTVRCAHGLMPVPVPAVMAMLSKHPHPTRHMNQDTGELTTPTGCALVLSLHDPQATTPTSAPVNSGYGAGHKTIPGLTNLTRVRLYRETNHPQQQHGRDQVCELRAVIDDATGEELALTVQDLLQLDKVRDAWLAPIIMKKGRPGHELVVLGEAAADQELAEHILSHTPAIGVRISHPQRLILPRRESTVSIRSQQIAVKWVERPDGQITYKADATQLHNAAKALGIQKIQLRAELDQELNRLNSNQT